MSMPDAYFDVGRALLGGFRVFFIRRSASRQEQTIIETAHDVAAAAKLCDVPVLSADLDVRAACRERGVRLLNGSEDLR